MRPISLARAFQAEQHLSMISFTVRERRCMRSPFFKNRQTPSAGFTAYRRLVGTSIAAVPEEASGILSGDAVEGGSKRLLQGLEGVRGDPPQMGFHLGPSGFNRAEVRAVGRQIAIGKA